MEFLIILLLSIDQVDKLLDAAETSLLMPLAVSIDHMILTGQVRQKSVIFIMKCRMLLSVTRQMNNIIVFSTMTEFDI